MQDKQKALEQFFTENQKEWEKIEVTEYDENTFTVDSEEYMILTDSEADEKAKEYILESVWAFNADFIIEHSKVLDYDDASKQIVSAIAEQCESGNEAMKKLIDDIDEFVDDAISADGRGHFMSSYDGEEGETTIDKVDYYIYRTN